MLLYLYEREKNTLHRFRSRGIFIFTKFQRIIILSPSPSLADKRARSISRYIFRACRYPRPRAESFIIDISCQPRGLYTRIIESPYTHTYIYISHATVNYDIASISPPKENHRHRIYASILTFDLRFKISSPFDPPDPPSFEI